MTDARPTYEELLARVAQFEQQQHTEQAEALGAANRALRESELRYRTLLDASFDLIYAIGRDDTVEYVNAAALKMLRCDEEEVLGKPRAALFPPAVDSGQKQALDRVFSTGEPLYQEHPSVTSDGAGYQETQLFPIKGPDGGVASILGISRDITARRRAEEALRQSEEKYRLLVDNANEAILVAQDGMLRFVNKMVTTLTDYSEQELLTRPFPGLIHPDDRAMVVENYEKRVAGAPPPPRYAFRLLTREGGSRWVEISAVRIEWRGRPATLNFLADITDRNRAEDEVRASKAFLDNVINAIADPIFVKDEARRFVLVNDALCAAVGRPREGLIGRDGDDMFPEDQVEVFRKMDAGVFLTGKENLNEEYLTNLSTGEVSTIVTRKTRYVDPAGKRFLVGVIRDITELKRLQGSLAQADRLASMGMLAAGVAHEINNPLSYVLYNVESLAQDLPRLADAAKRCATALRERVGDAAFEEIAGDGAELLRPAPLDDAIDRAREALEGTHRIKDVARGLATFSRVEQVERAPVDVRHAVETAVHMATNEIKYRAQLVKDLGPVPTVMASEGKLSQVFLNLLINAAHSIDEGDVANNRIGVLTRAEAGDILVEISDTGRGIPPADLERIFEPFYSTMVVGKGAGLGLAICRNLVVELGGDIRVESRVGAGSRFVVRLPVARDEPQEKPAAAVPERPQPVALRGRILVVDDEESVRKAMVRLLGREHEVLCAGSGQAGRAILEQDASFDVILCDLMMPEMTGMDLHAWLAARDPALAARIVFVTGGAFTPRASEYLAGTGNLKVDKPFDPANLRKFVSKLIAAGRGGS